MMNNFARGGSDGENPGRRIGKGMAVGAWLVLMALLYYFFDDLVSKQQNPNQDPESVVQADGGTEVVLLRNRFNHYVSSGTINGTDVVFLLDTGATDVVIPEEVASRIGLPWGSRRQARTANGVIDVFATKLDRLSIGNLTLTDVSASINPHMGGEQILLGMSALGRVDIIQRGDELRLQAFPR